MALEIVDGAVAHVPLLESFFQRTYGADHVLAASAAFARWQFSSGDSAISLKLAVADGAVVACLGYVPVEVSLGARVVRGRWIINWMVDPAARGFALGPLLLRAVTAGCDVVLNVGPGAAAKDILRRMRWLDFGQLPRYVLALDPAAAGRLCGDASMSWPAPPPANLAAGSTRVTSVGRFSETVTDVWDAMAARGVAGTRRSSTFLNWRYADHPLFDYWLFEATVDDRVVGFAVCRLEQEQSSGTWIGRIQELCAEPSAQSALLAAVVRSAESRAAVLDFFCSSVSLASVMTEAGFLPGDHELARQMPVVFQPIDRRRTGIPFMGDLSRVNAEGLDWYVTSGDGDQDRPVRAEGASYPAFPRS